MIPHPNVAPPSTTLTRLLASGDGLIFFDHHNGGIGCAEILAAARACGRERDVRLLVVPTRHPPFRTSGKFDTFNPFAHADVDGLRRLFVSQIEAAEPASLNDSCVFKTRAVHLAHAISPVLVWLRDNRGVPMRVETISHALSYSTLASMAFAYTYKRPVPALIPLVQDQSVFLPVDETGDTLCGPLRSYFLETPGYDPSLGPDCQELGEPGKQHGYVTFSFRRLFQMAGELVDVFGSTTPDIEMDDVVANARILIVRVPSLEISGHVHESLVGLVLTSLRLVIGGKLAGVIASPGTSLSIDIEPAVSPRQTTVVLGDADALAVATFDMMAAQGRSLGVQFCSGFLDATDHPTRPSARLSLPNLMPAFLKGPPRSSPETAA